MEQLPHCVLSNMLASASELTGFLQLYLLVLYIHTLAWENSPKQKVVKSTFFFYYNTAETPSQAQYSTVHDALNQANYEGGGEWPTFRRDRDLKNHMALLPS